MIFSLIFLKFGVATVLSEMEHDKGFDLYYRIHTQNILFIINTHVECCLDFLDLIEFKTVRPAAREIVGYFKLEMKAKQNIFIEKVEEFIEKKLLKSAKDIYKFTIYDFMSLFFIEFWRIADPYIYIRKLINSLFCCNIKLKYENLAFLEKDSIFWQQNIFNLNKDFYFNICKENYKELAFVVDRSHFKYEYTENFIETNFKR